MFRRIPIMFFHGGRVRQGPYGAEYEPNAAAFSMVGTPGTTLDEVREFAQNQLGVPSSRLKISGRLNVSDRDYFFQEMAVEKDEDWRVILGSTLTGNYQVVSLFLTVLNPSGISRTSNARPPRRQHEAGVHGQPQQWNRRTPESGPNNEEDNEFLPDESDSDHVVQTIDPDHFETGEDYSTDTDTNPNPVPQHQCPSFHDITGMDSTEDEWFGDDHLLKGSLDQFQVFQSKAELLAEIQKFHVSSGREVKTKTSNPTKLRMECKESTCQWKLYAVATGMHWQIRKNPYPHTCFVAYNNQRDHSQLTATLIAQSIIEDVRADLNISINTVRSLIKAKYPGVMNPHYSKLWRGREKAIGMIFGNWKEAYGLLPSLFMAINQTNPDMRWDVVGKNIEDVDPQLVRHFVGAAWAFGPCIKAWPYLRPVVSIDACFLSGRYGGRLLTMCGYDAENHLVPIAFGLVEKESEECWGFFMNWVRINVIQDNRLICVISDRHKAIKAVFKSNYWGWCEAENEAVHRLCVHHVAENLYKKVRKDQVLKLFRWTSKR